MIEKWIPQYDKLNPSEQQYLDESFKALDIGHIEKVYEETYVNHKAIDMEKIEEIQYVSAGDIDDFQQGKLKERAEGAIYKGEFAVLLMAGGQGTRLQHPGPKGTFSFDGVSLFELQARQLKKYMSEDGAPVHWYIMTRDRKSTRLNSSHVAISYAVLCLKHPALSVICSLSLHDALPICHL